MCVNVGAGLGKTANEGGGKEFIGRDGVAEHG